MNKQSDSTWQEIHKESVVFDLHAHPSLKLSILKKFVTLNKRGTKYFDPFSVRSDFKKLAKGNVNVLCSTLYSPENGLKEDFRFLKLLKFLRLSKKQVLSDTYFELTLELLDEVEKIVEKAIDRKSNKQLAKMALSVQELDEIINQGGDGPVAVVHNVEGAHCLDGKIDHLEALYHRGVAYMTLAHFYPNEAASPVYPFPEYIGKIGKVQERRDLTIGLTKFGREVVERMIDLGMIIDITHCTPIIRKQIYEIVDRRAPIIASHIGVYDINPNPYNLQDWEIKEIADSGGIIGVIFMNYWLAPYERKRGIDFIIATLRHLIQVAGDDHIALGSDFDGFTDPPDDLMDASQFPYLTQRLVAEGFSKDLIFKILGENALRLIREGWGKKQ
jgi:membrane dipeptidase